MFESDLIFEDTTIEEPPVTASPKPPTRRTLSYEDQLCLWCLALKLGIAGKVAPVQAKGIGSKAETEYALLVNDTNAVALLNAKSDLDPISIDNLRAILKRFRRSDPPFPSAN